MLNKRWTAFLVLLILLGTVTLSAQTATEWYTNKQIIDIRFTGLKTVSETELNGIVRPYISRRFTDSLSWEIQGKLYALEYFDLILPQVIPGDDNNNTVVIEYQVKEKPVVEEIIFTGNNRVRKGELNDTILLTRGDMVNKSSIRLDGQALKSLYIEKGFVDAQVESNIEKDEETNTATVVFDIQEGSQTTIKEIRFVGNDLHVTSKTLQGLMTTKAQSLFNKGLLMENELQEDVRLIENYYGDRGFIDAEVSDINKDIAKDEETQTNNLIITLVIHEGSPYTFSGIEFEGNTLYSSAELQAMISQDTGKIFNRTRFQFDYQKVTDIYYENGYIYNTFSIEENRDDVNFTVSYMVNIIERDRAHIENIVIRGNEKTKDHVITRELPFEVGDVFSKAKVMEGIRNLYNTQFFSVVEPQTYPGSEDGLMDLVVDIEEGKTADIVFGLSFSGGQDFPLAGNIKWNDRNFMGTGRTVGVDSTFSPDNQSLSLQYSEPHIFNSDWGAGVDLTYRHSNKSRIYQDLNGDGVVDPYVDEADFEDANKIVPTDYLMEYSTHYVSTGLNTGYTWKTKVGRFNLYSGIRGGLEYVDYDDEINRPWSQGVRENLETWKYHDSYWLKGAWDTRDFVGNPSKGFILSQTTTLAGILDISSKNFLKSVSRGEVNFTLFDIPVTDSWKFKSVLSFKSAFSYLAPKPWNPIPIDPQEDGFYADGMFVARGWYPESDGQSLWDNTITLKFPIVPNIIAYDFFLDAVGLWKSQDQLTHAQLSDMKFSLGTGIRFDNPQFPIGIYLVKKFNFDEDGSVNWNPEPDTVTFKNGNLDLVISFGIDIY
ncbi:MULTISPECIES: outer membrane protein assembly factor BamA [unclassified Oceanispirochaeta]|uniref:outer membrane protein assembly factor BamA n=1 Tax=unclassified Oceanispirochaeta TaxID=2635722 RepID=UPI000E08FFD1|nr:MULTISPECIES: outer membrane protein assembly factor BamA [unclassified Oceanispirochaeta]MBF9017251.1 outer membrane protein assembly factor BamA [Oceanispirochaeta sp. M2]NPD73700.1 outer membrane protein assembly factor BamA [Oceanispirochaeta sp. M1]RDG30628.1 outer membrane protein assembly factor BamA [Oceanispirochaeta sp. M1]